MFANGNLYGKNTSEVGKNETLKLMLRAWVAKSQIQCKMQKNLEEIPPQHLSFLLMI